MPFSAPDSPTQPVPLQYQPIRALEINSDLEATAPEISYVDYTIPRRGGPPIVLRFPEGSRGLLDFNLNGRDLSGADFVGTNLAGVNFSNCTLNGARFERCILSGAEFVHTQLNNAVMIGCNARGANFDEASIQGTSIIECDFDRATFRGTRCNPQTEFRETRGHFEFPREYLHQAMYRNPVQMWGGDFASGSSTSVFSPITTATEAALQREALSHTAREMERLVTNNAVQWEAERTPRRRRQPPIIERDDVNGFLPGFRSGVNALLKEGNKQIKPRTYRFGIEIESYRPCDTVLNFRKTNFGIDGSINPPSDDFSGFEARSMPMKYRDMQNYVAGLSKYLIKNKCDVNESCGLHVHASHPAFFKRSYLRKLVMFWTAVEDVLISTQPKSRFANHFCQRALFQYITDYGMTVPRAKEKMIQHMGNKERYCAMNLSALAAHGTIEIRLHAGTINGEKISNWITLLQSIYNHVLNDYNNRTTKDLFEQEIGEDKIRRVFDLIKLPEEVKNFYLQRIEKFGWKRLQKQTKLAKECIVLQKEKMAIIGPIKKLDRKINSRIKELRGEKRRRRRNLIPPDAASPSHLVYTDPGGGGLNSLSRATFGGGGGNSSIGQVTTTSMPAGQLVENNHISRDVLNQALEEMREVDADRERFVNDGMDQVQPLNPYENVIQASIGTS